MQIKLFFSLALSLAFLTHSFSQNPTIMLPTDEKAPIYCKKTIQINASPEKVWKILTDIDHWNTWMTSVSHSKLNGSLAPATTFDFKAGGMKIHSKLHTVQPYANVGWTGKVMGINAIHNWTFTEVNGTTQVTVSERMEGFLAKLFKKSFNKTIEKDMIKSLEELKNTCEK